MNLYSKLTIFYQNRPPIRGKLTSFVTVLAQNTCVCVVIDRCYTVPKSTLMYWKGS